MPFTYNSRLIAVFAQYFGKGLLRTVEHTSGIIIEFIATCVFAGKHAGTARPAQRVGNKTIDKAHTVVGDAI